MKITNELLGRKIKMGVHEAIIIGIDSDEDTAMRVAGTITGYCIEW